MKQHTVFLRIDAVAFINFVGQFGVEGGIYSRAAFILLGNMTSWRKMKLSWTIAS